MRRVSRLTFSLALLSFAVAVGGASAADAEVIEKMGLTHTHPAGLFRVVRHVPTGVSGVLAYPLDNALIVRGTAPALAEFKSALRIVDVPLEVGRRLVVKLEQGNPARIRAAALALPQPGAVEIQGKTLSFEGKPEWLEAVRGVVFDAELVNPRPREGVASDREGFRAARPTRALEILVPAGGSINFHADRVHHEAGTREMRLEGAVTVTLPGGVALRSEADPVTVRPGPEGGSRIVIEVSPGSPSRR